MDKKIIHWNNVNINTEIDININTDNEFAFAIYFGGLHERNQSVFMMNEEMVDHLIFQLQSAKHEYGVLIENSTETSV